MENCKYGLVPVMFALTDAGTGDVVDDVTDHDFNQLVTDYFARLNLNAGVQKLLAVCSP